jgi:peptide/nickel transport system permease protein
MTYALRRLGELALVLVAISMLSFAVLHLTGDPAIAILGPDATDEALARLRSELGLDRPLATQYWDFLTSALRGDFGDSTRFRQPAIELFVERLPATLELAAAALLLSLTIGGTVGVLAAVYRNSFLDRAIRATTLLGQAIPGFFLGIALIIVFAAQLRLLPAGGRGTLAHLILPAFTLGTYFAAITARFVRGAMLEVLGADFVRTARSKGLGEARVVLRHALRNSLIGVLTLVGLQIGSLLSGAVVVETVFSWPGVGRLAVQAIYTRDFPVVQVTIILSAVIFVVVNLLIDIAYSLVDPRIRLDGMTS